MIHRRLLSRHDLRTSTPGAGPSPPLLVHGLVVPAVASVQVVNATIGSFNDPLNRPLMDDT